MKTYVAIADDPVRRNLFPEENVRYLESLGKTVWATGREKLTPERVAAEIGDADVYMTMWGSPRLDKQILDAAPNIKLLVHLGGTVVPYVSPEMWDRGIRAISGNEHMAESVAEACIAYMLTALRNIPHFSRNLKENHTWKTRESYFEGLLDKTVGIVSFGAISKYLVTMLQPFHCKIKLYSRKALPKEYLEANGIEQVSMEEIFSTCDVISIQTALNDHTKHMINRDLLHRIKPGALFLNTARGAVVDQEALIDELRDGRFRAFLDVYENGEPPKPECELYNLENVFMMPHMGGPTIDRYRYSTRDLITEANRFLTTDGKGSLQYEITREMADSMSRS